MERATFSDDDPYGMADETTENREKGFLSKYEDETTDDDEESPIPDTMSEIEKHEEIKKLKEKKEKIEKKLKEFLKEKK